MKEEEPAPFLPFSLLAVYLFYVFNTPQQATWCFLAHPHPCIQINANSVIMSGSLLSRFSKPWLELTAFVLRENLGTLFIRNTTKIGTRTFQYTKNLVTKSPCLVAVKNKPNYFMQSGQYYPRLQAHSV